MNTNKTKRVYSKSADGWVVGILQENEVGQIFLYHEDISIMIKGEDTRIDSFANRFDMNVAPVFENDIVQISGAKDSQRFVVYEMYGSFFLVEMDDFNKFLDGETGDMPMIELDNSISITSTNQVFNGSGNPTVKFLSYRGGFHVDESKILKSPIIPEFRNFDKKEED